MYNWMFPIGVPVIERLHCCNQLSVTAMLRKRNACIYVAKYPPHTHTHTLTYCIYHSAVGSVSVMTLDDFKCNSGRVGLISISRATHWHSKMAAGLNQCPCFPAPPPSRLFLNATEPHPPPALDCSYFPSVWWAVGAAPSANLPGIDARGRKSSEGGRTSRIYLSVPLPSFLESTAPWLLLFFCFFWEGNCTVIRFDQDYYFFILFGSKFSPPFTQWPVGVCDRRRRTWEIKAVPWQREGSGGDTAPPPFSSSATHKMAAPSSALIIASSRIPVSLPCCLLATAPVYFQPTPLACRPSVHNDLCHWWACF